MLRLPNAQRRSRSATPSGPRRRSLWPIATGCKAPTNMCIKFANLRQNATIEDLNTKAARGLDKALFAKLATGDWIGRRYDLLITGKTGTGKSWLACALGHKAYRDDRSELYYRVPRLLDALALVRGDGRYVRLLNSLARVELLILDDWGLAPLTSQQGRDLLEIVDDRHGRGSTIVTSQLPVDHWHEVIVDPHNRRCRPRPPRAHRPPPRPRRRDPAQATRKRPKARKRRIPRDCPTPHRSRSPPTGRPNRPSLSSNSSMIYVKRSGPSIIYHLSNQSAGSDAPAASVCTRRSHRRRRPAVLKITACPTNKAPHTAPCS